MTNPISSLVYMPGSVVVNFENWNETAGNSVCLMSIESKHEFIGD